jgi:hypothetical protein
LKQDLQRQLFEQSLARCPWAKHLPQSNKSLRFEFEFEKRVKSGSSSAGEELSVDFGSDNSGARSFCKRPKTRETGTEVGIVNSPIRIVGGTSIFG